MGANAVLGMAVWICFRVAVKVFFEAWHMAITLGFQSHLLFVL